MLTPRGKMQRR